MGVGNNGHGYDIEFTEAAKIASQKNENIKDYLGYNFKSNANKRARNLRAIFREEREYDFGKVEVVSHIPSELRLRWVSDEDEMSTTTRDYTILSDSEKKCDRCDSVTEGITNERQETDERIIKFSNAAGKYSGHTVTVVTPIPKEIESSLSAEQKPDNKNALYASYYREDRYKVLAGLPNLKCLFCNCYSPIIFDMELHLYELHKENLLNDLPIRKKRGFRMDNRITYAINLMKSDAVRNRRYFA